MCIRVTPPCSELEIHRTSLIFGHLCNNFLISILEKCPFRVFQSNSKQKVHKLLTSSWLLVIVPHGHNYIWTTCCLQVFLTLWNHQTASCADLNWGSASRKNVTIAKQWTDINLAALQKDALFCVPPSFAAGWGTSVGWALVVGKLSQDTNKTWETFPVLFAHPTLGIIVV